MLRPPYRRNPIYKLIGLALPLASFVLSYLGFQELRSRPLLPPPPTTTSSAQASESGTTRTTSPFSPSWKMNGAPNGEEFHQSMRLFLRGSDFREIRDVPTTLKWGRVLAVATVLYASIFGAMALFRQSLREIRLRGFLGLRSRPCALVFELPEHLLSLIPELKKTHCESRCLSGRTRNPVVVVLRDLDSVVAKACQRAGLWVIESTLHEEEFLSLTGMQSSTNVYIFGDDSATNLELALRCQAGMNSSEAKKKQKPANHPMIHVQVEDPDVRYAYQTRAIGSQCSTRVSIAPFSIPENAARLCLDGGRLASLPPLADEPEPSSLKDEKPPLSLHPDTSHILCGEGRWLRAFLSELLKGSVIDLHVRPTIHVVCSGAYQLQERFETEVPAHKQLHCQLHFHEVPDNEPESFTKKASAILASGLSAAPLNLFCLLQEDGDNLSLASRLCAMVAKSDPTLALAQRTRIHFLARLTEGLGAEFTSTQAKHGPFLHPIGAYSQSASIETIARAPIQQMASFISGEYEKNTLANRDLWHRINGGLPALNALTGLKREQNFAQADHIDIKLANLGLPPAKDCDLAQLQALIAELRDEDEANPEGSILFALAELEHLRWTQVHLLAGTEYAPIPGIYERHPEDYRLHDCVIPCSDPNFDRKTIFHDKAAVLLLPELVAIKQGLSSLTARDNPQS